MDKPIADMTADELWEVSRGIAVTAMDVLWAQREIKSRLRAYDTAKFECDLWAGQNLRDFPVLLAVQNAFKYLQEAMSAAKEA